ncbi:MAG: leucine--tRNA ligase [Patescibacteria group bacterium]
MKKYEFSQIDKKWQEYWKSTSYGVAKDEGGNKHYHLIEFPYPSGEGLHVGHCMGYGASDAYCRMKRMQGFNVMFPIGWDAFGLPTENYAIKTGIHPRLATKQSIDTFKKQIESLGYSFDWKREINTTDPEYYKWTQWIFLQFYKHGIVDPSTGSGQAGKLIEVADDDTTTPRLAYQAEMPINWCPSCKIGLANEEVIAGKCERCGTETIKKMQKQWLLRITAYADRLISDLDTVDYLDKIKTQQVNWIGRSTGTNIRFTVIPANAGILKIPDQVRDDNIVEIFTTRTDTLFGCTYIVLSPEHPIIAKLKTNIANCNKVNQYIEDSAKKSDMERTELAKEKTGVKLESIKAINPINNEEIDVWIADYVLASYGTGAVMAVPAHDERDFEFAKKYDIDIKQVITGDNYNDNKAFTEYGILIHSGGFDGLTSKEAQGKITIKLKEIGAGDFTVNYKLRDWIFSRQHYWGEPIPIIHCDKCGTIPMDENDLPLTLPEVENYQPTVTGESPLAAIPNWVNTTCPECGGPAKRETDTMPNWAGSSWYFLRYCDPKNMNEFASMDKLEYWLNPGLDASEAPRSSKSGGGVDIYNGGMEHTTLHLLYSRFWHKFLYDLGKVPSNEPYQKRIAHGIILGPDGQKMSKSRDNVINPDKIVEKYGSDTLRTYIMFIGPYDQESAWNTSSIQGVYRFLNRLWNNYDLVNNQSDEKDLLIKLNQTIDCVTADLESFNLNTVVSKLMEMNNMIEKIGHISKDSYSKYLKLIFPVAPHISSELFEMLEKGKIEAKEWPKTDLNYLSADQIEIVVQINGKVRAKMMLDANISDQEMVDFALNLPEVKEYIEDKKIVKIIPVAKKLVSIVIA